MITRIKLFAKGILKVVNSAAGHLLPVTDSRTGDEVKDVNKVELAPSFIIEGDAPLYNYNTNQQAPYWISLFRKGVHVPSTFMLVLHNACMVGRGVILYNNRVLLESAIFQREYLDKLLLNHSIGKALLKKPGKKLGNVIPLLNKLSNNYYHWTTESLTRLAMLAEYSNENYADYSIVIAADSPAFVKESLVSLFKVSPEKIITWKNDEIGTAEKCILLSYPFARTPETVMTNVYNLPLYRLLNSISLKNIPSQSTDAEYIIISRKFVRQRKLADDEKILQAFPHIPFRIIYTEKMSYIEQVTAFRNAKIIIGPHGAGLINLVYVTQKPLVIELFPTTRKIRDAGAYHQVARALNIDYYLLVKEPFNEEQDILITDEIVDELRAIISKHNY